MPLTLLVLPAYGSVRWRVSHRQRLDIFADGVSAFLDDKCYKKKSLPSFLYMKSERVLVALGRCSSSDVYTTHVCVSV